MTFPGVTERDQRVQITQNQVREVLIKQFNEVLAFIPQTEDEVLVHEVYVKTGITKPSIPLLNRLVRFLWTYSRNHTTEEIRKIMFEEGALEALLKGDEDRLDFLYQRHIQ